MNIQAPEIKPLVDGESAIENGGGLNEAKDKHQESKYASHFEYISTMASIEDAFFKTNIRKDLLKDRHVTWSAFKTLSPQLVRLLARIQSNTNLIRTSNTHLQLTGTFSHGIFPKTIHPGLKLLRI